MVSPICQRTGKPVLTPCPDCDCALRAMVRPQPPSRGVDQDAPDISVPIVGIACHPRDYASIRRQLEVPIEDIPLTSPFRPVVPPVAIDPVLQPGVALIWTDLDQWKAYLDSLASRCLGESHADSH